MQSRSDAIRGYFAAFKSGDRAHLERALAEDFTFTSPYDDGIDKATYFARCWPNRHLIREHVIERIFEQGDEGDCLYAVQEGEVEVVVNGVVVETVGPRGMFGELALIDQERRSSTAVAKTDCRLEARPVGAPRQNAELADSATSSARCPVSAPMTAIALSAPSTATWTWSPKISSRRAMYWSWSTSAL